MNIKTILKRKHFHWLTAAQRNSLQGGRKGVELEWRMEPAAVMPALAALPAACISLPAAMQGNPHKTDNKTSSITPMQTPMGTRGPQFCTLVPDRGDESLQLIQTGGRGG